MQKCVASVHEYLPTVEYSCKSFAKEVESTYARYTQSKKALKYHSQVSRCFSLKRSCWSCWRCRSSWTRAFATIFMRKVWCFFVMRTLFLQSTCILSYLPELLVPEHPHQRYHKWFLLTMVRRSFCRSSKTCSRWESSRSRFSCASWRRTSRFLAVSRLSAISRKTSLS